jgi:hypothetical protein
MSTLNPRTIRDALCERDVALKPPITADALDRLTRWAGAEPHHDVLSVLREFDGFSDGDFDAASFVSIWLVDKALADYWTKRPMLAFSDWSLNAFIFGFDPVTAGPVISIEDGRQVAPRVRTH